jgi:hypothetical protein
MNTRPQAGDGLVGMLCIGAGLERFGKNALRGTIAPAASFKADMPPRSPSIPHMAERVALQRLSGGGELPATKLHPAAKGTLSKMIFKGWIEGLPGGVYRITAEGRSALTAKIPDMH